MAATDENKTGLSAKEIKENYIPGLPLTFTDSGGTTHTIKDEAIGYHIKQAEAEIERKIQIDLGPLIIITKPEDGEEYDYEEDPYDFEYITARNFFYVSLRRRPVISVEKIDIVNPFDDRVILEVPVGLPGQGGSWLKLYKNMGQFHLVPQSHALALSPLITPGGMTAIHVWMQIAGQILPAALHIDYTSGYADSSKVPMDIVDIVAWNTAMRIIRLADVMVKDGMESRSIGADGLSQSWTPAQYQQTLKDFREEMALRIEEAKQKFRPRKMRFM